VLVAVAHGRGNAEVFARSPGLPTDRSVRAAADATRETARPGV